MSLKRGLPVTAKETRKLIKLRLVLGSAKDWLKARWKDLSNLARAAYKKLPGFVQAWVDVHVKVVKTVARGVKKVWSWISSWW